MISKNYAKSRMTVLASVILLAVLSVAYAQQRMVNPVGRIQIDRSMDETPEFDVRNMQTDRGDAMWLEINVDYETVTEWVDELEFVFYVFMNTNMRDTPKMLLSYTVSYVDIEKGSHKCAVYMHPNTYERYVDDIEFIGVEVRHKGRPVRWTSDKSNMRDSQWWEQARQQFPPVTGKLMAREDTPFALVNPDEYELRKRPER